MSSDSEYSENESEKSSEDDDNEIENLGELFQGMGLEPYQFEPMKKNNDEGIEEISKIDTREQFLINHWENLRVGKTDWCSCKNCQSESREIDCVCCREIDAITDEQFSSFECIAMAEGFRQLCLVKLVLENVLTGFHQTRGDILELTPSNKSLRLTAYKQFIWFVYKWLGKGNRRVIPSCVVWKIRETFPEEDGLYIPYTEE